MPKKPNPKAPAATNYLKAEAPLARVSLLGNRLQRMPLLAFRLQRVPPDEIALGEGPSAGLSLAEGKSVENRLAEGPPTLCKSIPSRATLAKRDLSRATLCKRNPSRRTLAKLANIIVLMICGHTTKKAKDYICHDSAVLDLNEINRRQSRGRQRMAILERN